MRYPAGGPTVRAGLGGLDCSGPANLSDNPNNARVDPESIKIANNGLSVFISDEYGPYVYQFERASGARIRSFSLPDYDHPSRIFIFASDQADLDALGTAGTAQGQGWKYVAQPLVTEQFPDFFSPEQFPSFLFGAPTFHSRGGFPLF